MFFLQFVYIFRLSRCMYLRSYTNHALSTKKVFKKFESHAWRLCSPLAFFVRVLVCFPGVGLVQHQLVALRQQYAWICTLALLTFQLESISREYIFITISTTFQPRRHFFNTDRILVDILAALDFEDHCRPCPFIARPTQYCLKKKEREEKKETQSDFRCLLLISRIPKNKMFCIRL